MLFSVGGVSLLALAALAWLLYRRNVAKVAEAASWPRVEGIVETSRITFHPGRDDDNDSWSHQLAYRYTAGGQELTGKKIRFGPNQTYHVERTAEEAAVRYAEGSSVSVAYNPARPEECVIETDRATTTWRFFAFVLAAIGIGFIVLGFLPSE